MSIIASLIRDTESRCCQSKKVLSLLKHELKIFKQSRRDKHLLVKMENIVGAATLSVIYD